MGDKRDISLPSLCLVGRLKEWKIRGIENFFVWLRKKWDDWKCSLYKFTHIPLLDKLKKKKVTNYIFIKIVYGWTLIIKKKKKTGGEVT